jgi:hypothetical protein
MNVHRLMQLLQTSRAHYESIAKCAHAAGGTNLSFPKLSPLRGAVHGFLNERGKPISSRSGCRIGKIRKLSAPTILSNFFETSELSGRRD